jgi:hypothetical protein
MPNFGWPSAYSALNDVELFCEIINVAIQNPESYAIRINPQYKDYNSLYVKQLEFMTKYVRGFDKVYDNIKDISNRLEFDDYGNAIKQ